MKPEERRKQFIAEMTKVAQGGHSPWRVFGDFCEMAYCSVSKPCAHPDRREKIEERYMSRVKAYDKEQVQSICNMLGMVVMAAEDRRDFLGHIYESEGFCDAKYGAQFFTPEHISDFMAEILMSEEDEERKITMISEPTCGSGRMVYSACKALDDKGVDVPTRVWAEACDLDPVCCQMTYLQMAFMGIPGVVRHMNTLSLEQYDMAITPAGAKLYNESEELRARLEEKPVLVAATKPAEPAQGSLFG